MGGRAENNIIRLMGVFEDFQDGTQGWNDKELAQMIALLGQAKQYYRTRNREVVVVLEHQSIAPLPHAARR
jgi:hypothetical protein